MTDNAIQRSAPSGMELLAEALRNESDPQARIELGKQIVALQSAALNVDVEREKLRQARERFDWEKLDREAKVAFTQAFEDFKRDAPKILKTHHVEFKNKSGDVTSYWHVELDKACDILTPALLKVGITHRWVSADLPDGRVRVTCYLRHRLGHEEQGASLAGPPDTSGGKNPIQGVGSSTSYLERYTFLASLGLVPTGADNDGNPPGMSQEDAEEYLRPMQEAETPAEVMEVWIKAIAATKKLEPIDYRAMTIFTEARDAKLKELKKGAK